MVRGFFDSETGLGSNIKLSLYMSRQHLSSRPDFKIILLGKKKEEKKKKKKKCAAIRRATLNPNHSPFKDFGTSTPGVIIGDEEKLVCKLGTAMPMTIIYVLLLLYRAFGLFFLDCLFTEFCCSVLFFFVFLGLIIYRT